MIALAITGLVLVALAATWLGSLVRDHGAGPVAWRFLAGRHLDGRHRTDATWSRPATRVLHVTGHASRWAHQAERARAGYRLAGLGLVAGLAALWLLARPAAPWLSIALAVAGATLGAWRAGRALRSARHRRRVVRPMSAALAPFLGTTARAVEARLSVRRDFEDAAGGEHVASLGLPDHWAATPGQKTQVEEVIGARLGVDLRHQWRTAQHPMLLNVARAPQPPAMVRFAAVRAEIEACPADKVLLGVDSAGEFRYGDLALEDPHWAVNAGSRRGKTSLLQLIAAQVLRQGGERVTGIDPKRVSLEALAGVPGVDLHADPRDVEDMWAGIRAFREFMDARVEAYAADRTAEFRRALLIIDEINQFSAMSDAHWREVKAKSDPARPPVWADVAAVAWQGAQFRCNIIVVGQRLDQGALGGLRDSFGVRLLAGFTPQQYAFLVGLPPVPRAQKPRGRFLLFEGGELHWLQLVYGTPEELRDYAMGGRRGRADLGGDSSHGSVTDGLVGLREAVERGVLSCTLDAARRARAGDPSFPEPAEKRGQEHLYAAADLRRWERSRPRAGARRFEPSAP